MAVISKVKGKVKFVRWVVQRGDSWHFFDHLKETHRLFEENSRWPGSGWNRMRETNANMKSATANNDETKDQKRRTATKNGRQF